MAILSTPDLQDKVKTTILNTAPYSQNETARLENLNSFNNLSRTGLTVGNMEKRILLYETQKGEKVFYQYPGKDEGKLDRNGNVKFEHDGRPKLQKRDGTWMKDQNFREIWRCFEGISGAHQADLPIVGVILVRIAYMIGYKKKDNDSCRVQELSITKVNDEYIETITNETYENFTWNKLELDSDAIETLNDRFGDFLGVSFEGMLYYIDLIAQNEDCKYLKPTDRPADKGRVNNCKTHLTVISFLRGQMSVSQILDLMQRQGVAPLAQNRFAEACDTLLSRT